MIELKSQNRLTIPKDLLEITNFNLDNEYFIHLSNNYEKLIISREEKFPNSRLLGKIKLDSKGRFGLKKHILTLLKGQTEFLVWAEDNIICLSLEQ